MPFMKRWADIKPLLPPIITGQLAIDEDGAAGVLAAGRLRIGRDDAISDGLGRSAFWHREE